MSASEIRCTAPHPAHPGRQCRAKLADAVLSHVVVQKDGRMGRACVRVRCPRCSTEYVICLRGAAA